MKFTLQDSLKPSSDCDTLILFTNQNKLSNKDKTKTPQCFNIPIELKKLFSDSINEGIISGSFGETTLIRSQHQLGFKHILFCGVGKWTESNLEAIRSIGGTIESFLSSNKIKNATFNLNSLNENISPMILQALIEGIGLAAYRFDELMSTKEIPKEKFGKITFYINSISRAHNDALANAQILVETVCFSRRLGDLPGNLMTPTILANETKRMGKSCKVKVSIWNKARIKKEKLAGLLCVSQGSNEEPCLIKLEYNGAKASDKPIAFVGKGLTFDSGGISIKPSAGMEEMKYDMCGGANVIGAVMAIAKLKLKVNVIAFVPATENMPGANAVKPGDIFKSRNGKTYEVNNTDAEGRLILSDALTLASEIKPQFIVDAATLTGAMVVALGNTHTGYFTKDQKLKGKIEEAAMISGELIWNMPLCDHHTKDMKGSFADLSNLAASRGAGSATAAAFLEQFIENETPWAHFDIAGTGWATGNRFSYNSKKGASGVMIRTFVELARLYE